MLVSFDCYGTLVDWEKGITNALKPVLESHGIEVEDEEILEIYARIEPELERDYKPYKEILRMVIDEFGRRFGFKPREDERSALVDTIGDWPLFPDIREALLDIKKQHRIAVISNVDRDLFEKTLKNIGVEFDFIVTADMVKAYKPSLKVFEYAQRVFGVEKRDWIHVGQSVFHDIIPAKRFGIRAVLVKRRGYGATPRVEGEADVVVNDLRELADFLRR